MLLKVRSQRAQWYCMEPSTILEEYDITDCLGVLPSCSSPEVKGADDVDNVADLTIGLEECEMDLVIVKGLAVTRILPSGVMAVIPVILGRPAAVLDGTVDVKGDGNIGTGDTLGVITDRTLEVITDGKVTRDITADVITDDTVGVKVHDTLDNTMEGV